MIDLGDSNKRLGNDKVLQSEFMKDLVKTLKRERLKLSPPMPKVVLEAAPLLRCTVAPIRMRAVHFTLHVGAMAPLYWVR